MASTSVLLRSTVHTARRSLLAGACNCRTSDGSLNFKGKNRAHIHSNAKAQAEESPSTHTATVNAQSAFAQRTRSMPDEPAAVAAEETSVSQAAANEPVEEARPQPSTPEELEVFERRRRMSLSKRNVSC